MAPNETMQPMQITMAASALPPPHTLIEDERGNLSALMFYLALPEINSEHIANAWGYDMCCLYLSQEASDSELVDRYERGEDAESILADWHPAMPDGWMFGFKDDTEDGPIAVFIRKRPEPGNGT